MLEVRGLTKSFGELRAVDDICLSVSQGEVLGLIGPNGAGKSSTLKMICGQLVPDRGDASVCGFSICKDPRKAKLHFAYVPENTPLYGDLLVFELLKFVANLYHLPLEQQEQELIKVSELLNIKKLLYQKIESLSKSEKVLVSFAQALIHRPDVLILDGPTEALDPNQKYQVRELIKKIAPSKAILIATHILEELEEVCHRCLIISKGKKLFEGRPEELKAKSSKGSIQDVFRALTSECEVDGVQL